ncbi:hypothetical protein Aph01nite_16100 [Acrocarpospora phusangensis]|uniref:DUF4097 domain-containing protein n=1 Tax=Acrocarpospora phusangensis TaxID=1070424 RepID=A0A919UP53_9ACTN|nr:DUF4097 family beta strand repeat-containing protein [Acrocarpospora phusangensis]GIH23300.1 hypothetical protein Aph01nite_16100 [Acrocarpospora phusangensis]
MQKFATPQPITAELYVPAGRVRIIAGDRAETVVNVRPSDAANGHDVKAAAQTAVELVGGVLKVKAPKAPRLGRCGSVEIAVELPAGSAIDGRGMAADFHAEGRLGGAKVHTAKGDISLGQADGPVSADTAQGDIHVAEAISGVFELSTSAGQIEVGVAEGVSAGLRATTTYGTLHDHRKKFDGPVNAVDIRATTSYGDIVVR